MLSYSNAFLPKISNINQYCNESVSNFWKIILHYFFTVLDICLIATAHSLSLCIHLWLKQKLIFVTDMKKKIGNNRFIKILANVRNFRWENIRGRPP